VEKMIQTIKVSELIPNSDNPRTITDVQFEKLKKSIEDFPEMLRLRPIIARDLVVLGGNMRLKALTELGIEETYVIDAKELTDEQVKEFIIKDNLSFGRWDYDLLGNLFDHMKLDEWGMELDPNMFKDLEEFGQAIEHEEVDFSDYTIYFGSEEEMEFWYAFLKKLKNKFQDYDNVSERILAYIAETYGQNKMKESEMIMKFIGYRKNG